MNEDELYQEHILDHFEEPYHRGRIAGATHRHEDDNPLCGDFVHVDLEIGSEGKVRQAWFDGEGCCISQAAASMLVQHIEGRSLDDIQQFTAGDMLALFGARLTPNRQKCCLLPWRVLQAAVFSPTAKPGPTKIGPIAKPGPTATTGLASTSELTSTSELATEPRAVSSRPAEKPR